METFKDEVLKRTHNCGQLRIEDVDSSVRLCGWVRSYRDHGGVVFIDLRDRDGITQVVFESDESEDSLYSQARILRNEWVIAVAGKVQPRGQERENPKLPTGKIEVVVSELTVLNKSDTVPFEPDEFSNVSEEMRLKYRYIDLRRPEMANALMTRHKICKAMRNALDDDGFIEVETPFLTKSTPEGARDFLVPSRVQQGMFYALPQSPQLFKQILMVSGMDKYYQIVRCFRDEDLRADRQPEFTQIDLEMSFAAEADVMRITNKILRDTCKVVGKDFPADEDIPKIPYDESMAYYGNDRPDIRFEMFLHDVGEIVSKTDFKVFVDTIAKGGIVKAIAVPGGAKFTRKEIDGYTAYVGDLDAKGLAWCKIEGGQFAGGVSKFLPQDVQSELTKQLGANDGDIIFFVADKASTVNKALGGLRIKLGKDFKMYDENTFAWCWVTDFPMVEYNEGEKRWDALHHPFTAPKAEDIDKLDTDPGSVKARAYDIVCNGVELGGGSVRIHSPEIQKKVFELLGIGEEEAKVKFGFLLDALRFGAPPHGGLALGLDRIVMIMVGGQSLRDVIAFPKTQRAICPLTNAPGSVSDKQLAELDIRVITPAQNAPVLE